MTSIDDALGSLALVVIVVWTIGGLLLRLAATSCFVCAAGLLALGDIAAALGVAGCGLGLLDPRPAAVPRAPRMLKISSRRSTAQPTTRRTRPGRGNPATRLPARPVPVAAATGTRAEAASAARAS